MGTSVDRGEVQAAFDAWRRAGEANDWEAFVDCFTEDGTFVNSALPEPVRGREAMRQMTREWPNNIRTTLEWFAIDSNRVAFGWNERQGDSDTYRGMSTLVYGSNGRYSQYEGIFDTAALAAALGM